jgi:hypothetical protein
VAAPGYLAQQRRRVVSSLLQLAAAGLGLPLLVVLACADSVDNLVHGPFVMDGPALARVKAPRGRGRPPRHFVRVRTGGLHDFYSARVTSGAEPDDGRRDHYVHTEIDGRVLVVKYSDDGGDDRAVAPETPGGTVWRVGNLEPLDDWTKKRLLETETTLEAAAILPVMLHTGTRYRGGWLVLAGGLGLVAAFGLLALAVAVRSALKPGWPTGLSPEVAAQIDQEAADPEAVAAGTALLTRSYLLHSRNFGLDVIPLGDLTPQTEHLEHEEKVLGVVQGRRDHWLVLHTRDGRTLELPARRHGSERFASELRRRLAALEGR